MLIVADPINPTQMLWANGHARRCGQRSHPPPNIAGRECAKGDLVVDVGPWSNNDPKRKPCMELELVWGEGVPNLRRAWRSCGAMEESTACQPRGERAIRSPLPREAIHRLAERDSSNGIP
jgi:hypothetical protein